MNRTVWQVGASVLIGLAIGTGSTVLDGGSPRARLLASSVQGESENPPPNVPVEPRAAASGPAPRTTQARGAVIFQPGGKALVVLSRRDLKEFRRVGDKRARLQLPDNKHVDFTNPVQLTTGKDTSILALTFDVPESLAGVEKGPGEGEGVSKSTSGMLIVTVVDGTEEIEIEMPAAEINFNPCDCP